MLGLNRKAAARAAKEFSERKTKKIYLALVEGDVKSQFISASIGDDKDDVKLFKMKVDPQGL